jgi:hypothetical protein
LKLNGTHQHIYTVHGNLLGENVHTVKRYTEVLWDSDKEVCLEVNAEKIVYIVADISN